MVTLRFVRLVLPSGSEFLLLSGQNYEEQVCHLVEENDVGSPLYTMRITSASTTVLFPLFLDCSIQYQTKMLTRTSTRRIFFGCDVVLRGNMNRDTIFGEPWQDCLMARQTMHSASIKSQQKIKSEGKAAQTKPRAREKN